MLIDDLTKLQIALDDLYDADEEVRKAALTPGTDDDAAAAVHKAAAKKKVAAKQRLKALLDAAGDTDAPSAPEKKDGAA